MLYAYQCDLTGTGPCRVARITPDDVIDPSAWTYWTGDDWTDPDAWLPGPEAAAPMATLDGPDGVTLPVAAFTVGRNGHDDVYVMTYTPPPGFNDLAEVRVSATPVGPWSEPVDVTLPGCRDGQEELVGCYAATAQLFLGGDGELGLGYFETLVDTDTGGGQYVTTTVPYEITVR